MKQYIQTKLLELEKERGIKVLFACETGSRAWGFPSPDSDYDVRFIYMHLPEWYVSLSEKKDSIQMMLDDGELDMSGWDIRKALRLANKSNASMIERMQSQMVYMSNPSFVNEMLEIIGQRYSPVATMYHYLSMAKKFSHELEGSGKLKTLFYALRSAMACKWIISQDEMPPIDFKIMLDRLGLDESFKKNVSQLIDLKSQVDESYVHGNEPLIKSFVVSQIMQADELKNELKGASMKCVDLDRFLRKTIGLNEV